MDNIRITPDIALGTILHAGIMVLLVVGLAACFLWPMHRDVMAIMHHLGMKPRAPRWFREKKA